MQDRPLNFLALWIAACLFTWTPAIGQEAEKFDWRSDWELEAGLKMEIDAKGFSYPTQIAFVPNPGSGPKDPLYYVVELKGKVKVVANDRTVSVFASDFLPNPQGEAFVPTGAAGLCLDPVNGYIFATYAYLDDTNIYRNGIARFSTRPGQFGMKAENTERFHTLFKNEVAAGGHTIGPCQIKDGLLYVTVGYGQGNSSSLDIHQTNGKILRMTLDFKPVPENPFYEDDGNDTAADYVWAYGFRNPFGLKFVGDRLFATENGGSIDRFNEIFEGESYLADGTDWSIGARAAQVFSPSLGIVHLSYIPPDNTLFSEKYRDSFVAATAGGPGAVGPSIDGRRAVLIWQYDFENKRMASVPRTILQYRGKGMQLPVSVALGPDGLYFAALLPNKEGKTPIYRITHDRGNVYPNKIGLDQSPLALIVKYGCRQCHKIGGKGGKAGPAIDSNLVPGLTAKLNDASYAERVAKVEKIDSGPFTAFRKERAEILAASGRERVIRWLPVYLRQPKFDNPESPMPALGLNREEAQQIAGYLIQTTAPAAEQKFSRLDRIRFAVARAIPDLRYRHLVFTFLLGVILTLVAFWLIRAARARK